MVPPEAYRGGEASGGKQNAPPRRGEVGASLSPEPGASANETLPPTMDR